MSPIAVGFIGLPAIGYAWSTFAHLPYLKASQHYKIVAVLNSSLRSSQLAIDAHGLGPDAKAYGDAETFARDPIVDLVVCSVRVDRHYALIKPCIQAGKDCFVEWPLASNLQEAEELSALAHAHGVRTVVGLQGRFSGIYNKVKEVIKDDLIGDVLSTSVVAAAGEGGFNEPENYAYFYDRKVGGNILTIQVAHNLDNITYALGEITSFNAQLSIVYPKGRIMTSDGKTARKVNRDTHDQIMLQGTLDTTPYQAAISYYVRGNKPFKDSPALRWNIFGTRGELEICNPALLAADVVDTGATIKLHDFGSSRVTEIDWSVADEAEKSLPTQARNVARLYEAYAKGETEKLVSFEQSVKRHRMIDEMEKSSEQGRKGNYLL